MWRTCGSPICAGGVGHDRAQLLQQLAVRHVVVPRERADRDDVAVLADVRQVADAADVDEHRGLREPQLHQRQQRVPAGQDLRVVGRRRAARSRGRPTRPARTRRQPGSCRTSLVASWIARHTRSGEAGLPTSVTPRCESASTTALTTAGGEAIVPASPMPFTPSGFVVDGVSCALSVIDRGDLDRRRHQVLRHRRRDQVAALVVDRLLVQRLGDALRDAAVHLALHDHRVDHGAAVVDRHVLHDVGRAGLGVDLDHADVGAGRPREVRRVVDRGGVRDAARRRPAGRARATRSPRGPGSCAPCRARPSRGTRRRPTRGRPRLTSSSCAAIVRAFSLIFSIAKCSATPPTDSEREPYVSMPSGVIAVSPCSTSTSSGVDAEPVGHDLRPARLVALAVRRRAGLHDRPCRSGRHSIVAPSHPPAA